jgi:hypothetical protein
MSTKKSDFGQNFSSLTADDRNIEIVRLANEETHTDNDDDADTDDNAGSANNVDNFDSVNSDGLFPAASRVRVINRVARFFLVHDTKTGKMYQMVIKFPKCL